MPRPRNSSTKEKQQKTIAYFLELEIDNILCFKDRQYLNLSDKSGNPAQWTVILGDNGVGKTTLLRCIAGMSLFHEWEQSESHISLGEKIVKREENKDKTVNISPAFFHFYKFPALEEWRRKRFQEGRNYLYANFIFNKGLKQERKKKNTKAVCFYNMSEVIVEESTPFSNSLCYGYGATRTTSQVMLSDYSGREPFASLFSESASLINAEEWLLQADYSSKYSQGEKKDRILKTISSIKNTLINILPDINDFDFFLEEDLGSHPIIKFKTHYGWVAFSDLGLGYKTMIVWMLDLIIRLYERYPDSEDPLSEPAIVLVDEIDLHLHPKWQRQIMSFLTERFPNTQFIVTAHSPLVVQASQDANIVLLRREGDRVVIDNNPEIIDNWRVDQILTSLFELPSARPATLDPYIEEREQILSKAHLTEEDRTRLDELREKIGSLPAGERAEDRKAMDIIRRAAKLIEAQNQQ